MNDICGSPKKREFVRVTNDTDPYCTVYISKLVRFQTNAIHSARGSKTRPKLFSVLLVLLRYCIENNNPVHCFVPLFNV